MTGPLARHELIQTHSALREAERHLQRVVEELDGPLRESAAMALGDLQLQLRRVKNLLEHLRVRQPAEESAPAYANG